MVNHVFYLISTKYELVLIIVDRHFRTRR